MAPEGKLISIARGVDLFLKVEVIPEESLLATIVKARLTLRGEKSGEQRAISLVGRGWASGKIITSPMYT